MSHSLSHSKLYTHFFLHIIIEKIIYYKYYESICDTLKIIFSTNEYLYNKVI